MYWSISDFPELKKFNKSVRRRILIMITKELSLGSKYAIVTFISMLLGVVSTLLVGTLTSNGDIIGYTAYAVFGMSALLGYLYIINIYVRKNIKRMRLE